MENAAQAIKTAGAILLFVLALSISIGAFGEARQAAEVVLDYQDRDYERNAFLENSDDTERTVGLETIVPSIYKAYKENYKIVFKFKTLQLKENGLYKKRDQIIYSIDLENEVLGNDAEKEEFIKAILYGTKDTSNIATKFSTNYRITLNKEGIYDIIKKNNLKFEEKLGVYYQEELQGPSDTPETNRTKKRVITYVEK
ncbi:MAG: hypothetical protein HFE81_05430 [Bacilli bacterium]|nr:hypothetical protein [Bacilli bacterium]